MKANEKKPVKKNSCEKYSGVRSESLCNLSIESNLALNEAVRASNVTGICDVHVAQFDIL